MKKPKINFDAEKLKAFLVLHCEKFVLAAIVLLVVMFVYRGYQLQGLQTGRTPESLLSAAQQTTEKIKSEDVWNEIAAERQVSFDVVKLVDRGQQPTDASLYRLPVPWSKQDFPKLVPRTDPKLYAPLHLKVVSTTGPLAVFATMTDVDPLPETFPSATAPTTPVRPPPRRNTRPEPGYGDGDTGSGDGGRSSRGRRPPARAAQDELQGEAMADMRFSGGYGEGGGAAGGINPESILGYQSVDQSAIPKTATINTIMAVVPYEKQIEEFERAFASSLDYDATRDQPRYIQIGIERADVTANPQETDPAKLTWTKLSVRASEVAEATWAGYPEEVLDPNYLNFEILTHPAPPFLQRDLWASLTHPDVPLLSLNPQNGMNSGEGMPGSEQPGTVDGDLPPDIPRNPALMNGGEGGGFRGNTGSRDGGYGGEGGSGGRGARPAPTRGGEMGTGSADGYGSGEGGLGEIVSVPKYKLIRFNDTEVGRGKSYRYRVCVYYEDPNHPSSAFLPPSVQSLDTTVRDRLKNVSPKTYWVTSEWSQPSDATITPSVESFHAGKVVPPSESDIVPNKPKVPNKEPVATVLTVVYDKTKSVDVAAEKEVQRGSTLNFIADAEVIHPALKVVRKLEKYNFYTGAIVADMLGGQTIPPLDRRNDKPLQAPGELLIFDAAGNLHVQNETDDVEDFRRYVVPKQEMMPTDSGYSDPLGGEGDTGSDDGGDILGGRRRRS